MTEETEDSSATDSQNSTESLLNYIADVSAAAGISKPLCDSSDTEVARYKEYLQSNSDLQLVKPQCYPPQSTNNVQSYDIMESPYSLSSISGSYSGQPETSPTDSGYHSVSNVCVPRSFVSEATFPQRKAHRGDYNFHVFFDDCHRGPPPKNIPYTFSKHLRKLYVKMDVPCPIKFSLDGQPPQGSIIRTGIVFAADEDVHHPVKRCMQHTREDHSAEILRIVNRDSWYERWYGNHHSVVTTYIHANISDEPFSIQYQFGCRSSCPGGINRRSTYMMFLLEDSNGNILGRDLILLKMCSCPGRDEQRDCRKNVCLQQVNEDSSTELSGPAQKRSRLQDTCPGYRFLCVRVENYDVMRKINDALSQSLYFQQYSLNS